MPFCPISVSDFTDVAENENRDTAQPLFRKFDRSLLVRAFEAGTPVAPTLLVVLERFPVDDHPDTRGLSQSLNQLMPVGCTPVFLPLVVIDVTTGKASTRLWIPLLVVSSVINQSDERAMRWAISRYGFANVIVASETPELLESRLRSFRLPPAAVPPPQGAPLVATSRGPEPRPSRSRSPTLHSTERRPATSGKIKRRRAEDSSISEPPAPQHRAEGSKKLKKLDVIVGHSWGSIYDHFSLTYRERVTASPTLVPWCLECHPTEVPSTDRCDEEKGECAVLGVEASDIPAALSAVQRVRSAASGRSVIDKITSVVAAYGPPQEEFRRYWPNSCPPTPPICSHHRERSLDPKIEPVDVKRIPMVLPSPPPTSRALMVVWDATRFDDGRAVSKLLLETFQSWLCCGAPVVGETPRDTRMIVVVLFLTTSAVMEDAFKSLNRAAAGCSSFPIVVYGIRPTSRQVGPSDILLPVMSFLWLRLSIDWRTSAIMSDNGDGFKEFARAVGIHHVAYNDTEAVVRVASNKQPLEPRLTEFLKPSNVRSLNNECPSYLCRDRLDAELEKLRSRGTYPLLVRDDVRSDYVHCEAQLPELCAALVMALPTAEGQLDVSEWNGSTLPPDGLAIGKKLVSQIASKVVVEFSADAAVLRGSCNTPRDGCFKITIQVDRQRGTILRYSCECNLNRVCRHVCALWRAFYEEGRRVGGRDRRLLLAAAAPTTVDQPSDTDDVCV